ncbi:MAG: CopD family protein [Kofleriaceae bacterium]|jgi:putative copper resistance protein D|nr:CopD family protein [Kofleriaceae bacterium]MBP9168756.1 CopD family protein [Kofleriaceae bacterium]MBP9860090.1 CopD family protein [Kofleriaceae bacterium]
MYALYLASVWLHILAVVVWLGGAAFLVLAIVPYLRKGDRQTAGALLRDLGLRLRTVGWSCFAILTVTGTYNLWLRGVSLGDLFDPTWRRTALGAAVTYKLLGFFAILGLSIAHDFFLGPRAAERAAAGAAPAELERLRRWASWLARVTVVVALGMVALGVIIVRGWP